MVKRLLELRRARLGDGHIGAALTVFEAPELQNSISQKLIL
jgi:hypothetical protein